MERNNILSNIVKIRKGKGFSQDFVASKLGMKQAGYGLIENGSRGLQYDILLRIAVVFEMDVIDLITFPKKYIDSSSIKESAISMDEKVTLQIELSKSKKDQVFRLIFGENDLGISNK
ncbi:helix-turn-helix protein [Bacteroidales bacterium Barb4]|nr:helix-turn-helix protein [Bacteroidales bacterium Barb4]